MRDASAKNRCDSPRLTSMANQKLVVEPLARTKVLSNVRPTKHERFQHVVTHQNPATSNRKAPNMRNRLDIDCRHIRGRWFFQLTLAMLCCFFRPPSASANRQRLAVPEPHGRMVSYKVIFLKVTF